MKDNALLVELKQVEEEGIETVDEKTIHAVEAYLHKLGMVYEAEIITQEFLEKNKNTFGKSISNEKEEKIKELLNRLYRLTYWFCNEMLIEEQHVAEFEETCKIAQQQTADRTVMVTAAPGNARCMKGCMEDTIKVINFLRNKENLEYIESWQLAGAEAMLVQCKKDGVIPFDLPAALMATFGMWDELKSSLIK